MADPIYLSPHSLEDRLGWELKVPCGWATIVRVQTDGPKALITTDDGTPYRFDFPVAVMVRAPEVDDQCDGADLR